MKLGTGLARRSVFILALLMTPMGAVTAHDTPLPLGDGNISSSPVRGQVFSCQTNFRR
ncbi:MAG: hypothetical protein ACI8S3_001959, partial [Alphaproteobacteria bacterium]